MTIPAKNETNYARGVWAEEQAKLYLENAGFEILQQRYKTKFGEIDFIVRQRQLLSFVEVKVRASIAEALEAVTPRTRARIEQSALFFLSENPEYVEYDMRFDVIAINAVDGDDFNITHLDNAWEAGS